MQEKQSETAATSPHELVIVRVFDAPAALVFAAWTEPHHLARWSGPEGFTTPHHEMDLRPGGRWRACLRAPDGTDHWVQGVYQEIDPPRRLAMTHAWEDAQGQPGPQTLVTVEFSEEAPGRTRMHFRQVGFDSQASRDGHDGGWTQSFDRLAAHLGHAA
ncbi:SRPBCC domain-containing protein [Ramlibacter sp.]|uniref:SRPBCC family protein n=1 Tax=Ramlibacter sp. TaxID=1917967 RepID=UPI0017EDD7E5|nr:SRPBCC domain-containing protein [Ramlibacter sp.]MBA2673913.1 SRPBCC domain-containing protein [Ramlibacter sp.]